MTTPAQAQTQEEALALLDQETGAVNANPGGASTPPQDAPTITTPGTEKPPTTLPADAAPTDPDPRDIEIARLRQQVASHQQYNSQLSQTQEWQRFESDVQRENAALREQLLAEGFSEAQADRAVRINHEGWMRAGEAHMSAQERINSTNQAMVHASQLSQQTGMPIDRLLRYPDAQSRQLAAEDYKATNERITALERGQQQLQQNNAKQNGPPPQNFEGPGGGQSSLMSQIDAYGTGQTDSIPKELLIAMGIDPNPPQ